jgi:hypothetical protein
MPKGGGGRAAHRQRRNYLRCGNFLTKRGTYFDVDEHDRNVTMVMTVESK